MAAADIGEGDWVECVNARPHRGLGVALLTSGELYRVRLVWSHPADSARVGLCLEGIVNPTTPLGEYCYKIDRFRPIYSPKSSLIESLLTKADEPVSEDA